MSEMSHCDCGTRSHYSTVLILLADFAVPDSSVILKSSMATTGHDQSVNVRSQRETETIVVISKIDGRCKMIASLIAA